MNRIHHSETQNTLLTINTEYERQEKNPRVAETKIDKELRLDENMKYQLILNKLCFDNQIYFTERSDLNASSERVGKIFYQKQKEKKKQTDDQKTKHNALTQMSALTCSKKSNIFKIFFFLFLSYLFVNILIAPLSVFSLLIAILVINKKFGYLILGLMLFAFTQALFSTSFFYSYIAYGDQDQEDRNVKFYGINALTFVGLLYTVASQAGVIIFVLNYYLQKKKYDIKSALDDLEVPSDQLYFETIDRNAINNFVKQRDKKTNIYQFVERSKQEISQNLISISTDENKSQSHLKMKVWNSGYYLLSHSQLREQQLFVLSKNYLRLCSLLGISCILLHFILPIVYLSTQAEDDFDRWNIALIIVCNIFYSFFFISNCVISCLTYEPFSTVETFTSLLEIKREMSDHEFEKSVSTLNLYCITSIKTWFYIRQLMLNTNQFVFRFSNLLQSIDVVCFLFLSSILFMDFLGIGWKQNSIFQNKLIFSLMLSNILIRLILLIIPIFFNFSYVNDLLLYNKEQIYSIKMRLENIHSEYRALKNSWINQMKKLQSDIFSDITQLQAFNVELRKQSPNKLKDYMPCHKIEQMRVVYEIQRNAELFSSVDLLESTNFRRNYQDLSEDDKVHREIEYLSALIKTYKLIHEDMSIKEEKHLLKFLGIIPVSYAKAQAVLIIALPALFSIILQRVSQ